MKKITLQESLEIHQTNAIKYSKNISQSCQARINLLSLALENNTQPDDEGWVLIGDTQKEFRRLRGEPCRRGELHWINFFLSPEHSKINCFLWKTQIINYD